MKQTPILGLGIQSGFPSVTSQERINCYLEMLQDGEKSAVVAYGTPGKTELVDLGETPVRGGLSFNDYLYVAHRDNFYQINNAGVAVNKGSLNTTSGRVSMETNGFQLVVADGTTAGRIYEIRDDTVVSISNASPCVVTWTAHNMPVNAALRFTTTDTLPAGLSVDTTYYISEVVDVDNFKISATQGGANINTTSAGVGIQTAVTWLAPIDSFPALETLAFLDGYIVGNEIGTGKYYWSGIYAGQTWNALDFASAESNPDNLVAVFVDHGGVMLLGKFTTEIVGNSAGEDQPFTRIGYPVEWGLMAKSSVAKCGESVAFLARNRMGEAQVVLMSGYQPQRISTHDLERILNASASLESATGFSWMLNGHIFYQLNAAGKSWIYDLTSGVWSQLKSYGIDRDKGEIGFNLINRTLVSDYASGKIYTISDTAYSDDSDPLVMEISGKHIFNSAEFLTISEVDLEMEVGAGATSGQGSDPQVMLQISKDGGHTWGNERWKGFGKLGKYSTLVRWDRIGRAYNLDFRFRISDPVKRAIIGAWIR